MLFLLSFALAEPPPFPPRASVVVAALTTDPAVPAVAWAAEAAHAGAVAPPLAPLHVEGGLAPLAEMPGGEVKLGWMLPAPAMRAAQVAEPGAMARGADADVLMRRAELAARASQLVDAVWGIAGERVILAHHATVLRDAVAAVGRRVSAGLATPDQRVMAEMAALEVEEERIGLTRRARDAEAVLSAWIAAADRADARPPEALMALRAWAGAEAEPPADPGPVLGGPVLPPPAVTMAAADRDAAAAMVRMRRVEARPMTELMTSWSSMWGDPAMGFMVGLGVDIPLDGRALRARREAADASLRAATARVDAATDTAAVETARAEAAVEEMAAMEALMVTRMAPLSAEAVRLARAAYESNRGTLDGWLSAERDDAQTARRLVQARAGRRQMEAMLAMSRGQLAGLPDADGANR